MANDRNICRYCANVFELSKRKHFCIKKPLIRSKINLNQSACERFVSNFAKKKGEQ